MTGWIKLHRQFKTNGHFHMPDRALKIWLYILMSVSYQDKPAIGLKAGEGWISYEMIAEDCSEPGTRMRREAIAENLRWLEEHGYIKRFIIKGKGQKIAIPNWDKYQAREPASSETEPEAELVAELVAELPPELKQEIKEHKEREEGSTPPNPPKGERRRKRAADDEPDPRVQPVLRAFHDRFHARFGKRPTKRHLDFGRDGKRVRELPAEYTTEDLLAYIERFFRPDTPGWVSRDFTFDAFLLAIPKLQEVANGEHAAVSGGLAASGRGGGRTASPHRGREATTRLGDRLDRGFFAGVLQEDTA